MADASNVRHDTIVVPERMSPAQVEAECRRWMSVGKLNVNLLDLSRAADDYAELQTAAAAISPQAWIGNVVLDPLQPH